jgi:hypothetical protein
MNPTDIANQVISCMAKGHAFDQAFHAQAIAAKDRRIAELEKQLADIKAAAAAPKDKP